MKFKNKIILFFSYYRYGMLALRYLEKYCAMALMLGQLKGLLDEIQKEIIIIYLSYGDALIILALKICKQDMSKKYLNLGLKT